MKLGLAWKVVVVVALGGVTMWAVSYIDRIPPQRLAALLGVSVSVSGPDSSGGTEKITPSPSSDVPLALSAVAVQTFSGPVLVRYGTGTAVSVDGLVLTTVFAAPYGSGSFVYQVATPRGQLIRARRVASDVASGLVLLKAEVNDLDAILFDQELPLPAGSSWEAVSAQVIASRFISMRLPVWVVWSDGGRQTALSMDRAYVSAMNGARLVNGSGRSVGLIRPGVSPGLITAVQINAFLNRYLGEAVKN